jgi:DNA helicase II / ATP-dependent DNA helicase PcrA
LFLSFAQSRMLHGQIRYNTKSRFFNELPDEDVKWLTPRSQSNWFATPQSNWDSNGNFFQQTGFKKTGAISSAAKMGYFSQHNIATTTAEGWGAGLNVRHSKFGEGIIVRIEGSGNNCRAHIQFDESGLKVLDLAVAKLEKV